MTSLFLAIKYAASRYVPLVLLATTSMKRYVRVSIAALTSLQAYPLLFTVPSAFNSAVLVITVGSKYLSTEEYSGT